MRINATAHMPCGACPAGVYDYAAVEAGVALFGACESQRDALRAAPRCRHKPGRVCMGCRDFIVASTFPITDRAGEG